MSTAPINYSALAEQARKPAPPVDYAALAEKARSGSQNTNFADDVGETFGQYWAQVNPNTQAEGIVAPLTHPSDTYHAYVQQQEDLLSKSIDAFKNGSYSEGARHGLMYILNGIPGVGALLDRAGTKAGTGDYKGAIADTAALATYLAEGKLLGPLTDAAAEPGAITGPIKTAAGAVRKTAGALPMPGDAELVAGLLGSPHAAAALYIKRALPEIRDAFKPKPVPLPPEYDLIAKGLGANDYASAGPTGQQTIRSVYDQIQARNAQPARPAAAPQATPAASAPTVIPEGQPAASAGPASAPSPSIPVVQRKEPWLFDDPGIRRRLNLPEDAPAPAVTVIPSKAPATVRDFEAEGHAAKIGTIAEHFNAAGIDPSDVPNITKAQFKTVTDALGIKPLNPKKFSTSVSDIMDAMGKGKVDVTGTPSPALLEKLKKPGALEAAQKLADLMK